MNAQEYRERHATVTRLCADALRKNEPVTITADLSGAFATAGEATTYTPAKIRNYIKRVLTAVGRYNPAWGIAVAAGASGTVLADTIEVELTYTPTGNGFGSAFTSDALSRCAGKARSDADTSFVDGRRTRTRKPTISAEDKVWLRANRGIDWFGAGGKTDPVVKQASLDALAAHKAGAPAPTAQVKQVTDNTVTPEGLNELVETLMDAGMSEPDIIAAIRRRTA